MNEVRHDLIASSRDEASLNRWDCQVSGAAAACQPKPGQP
jgi:hypothetical protein